MLWIDVDKTALETGADPNDARLLQDCADAQAWVEERRWDLDFPDGLTERIHRGARMYAGLLWLQRSAPAGMPAYDEFGNPTDPGMVLMARVVDHVGQPRPVVA